MGDDRLFNDAQRHDSMVLEPNVRVLAAKMREQILAAEHAAMSLSARAGS